MDGVRLAFKNTVSVMIGEVTVKILALIVAIYLARYLGVENYGIYSFVTVYLTFFEIVAGFGLDPVIVRDVARDQAMTTKFLNNIFTIRLITSSFAVFFAIIGIYVMSYPEQFVFYVTLSSLILVFQSLSYMNESLFKAKLKMEYFAVNLIASKTIHALLISIAIFADKGLTYIFISLVLSEASRLVLNFICSKKFLNYSFEFDFSLWKYLLKESLPFLVNSVLLVIHYRVDVIMLSFLKGSQSVGFYSAAYKLTDPLLFIPGAISASLLPIISKQFISKKESMNNTFLYATRYVFTLMLPIVLGIFTLSDKFIQFIYGSSFLASAVALQILMGSLFFNSLNSMQNSALISINKPKLITNSILITCGLNVFLNAVLIPEYDYIGAALATLCSVTVLYLIQFYYVKKLLIFPFNKKFLQPLLSSIIMSIIILYIKEYNLFIIILISAISYILLMVFLKGYTEKDIEFAKRIIGKKF